MTKKSMPKKIYQLKITLLGSDPPIWRRIQIRSDIKLSELHDVLQDVMGWYDAHLHQFIHDGIYYGEPSPDDFPPMKDENKVRLDKLLTRVRSNLIYEYDFGDSWEHEVRVEKILEPEPNTKYPICIAGERACPPEDCGGVWGYADMLKILANPKDPEYEDWLDWAGDDFDPDEFDVDEVNEILK